ncbi:uncharacterized protein LOC107748254 isoform X2 [Sinocyclocheilus rhinocerous]|uniref:uncharacterized protein LOC107748254 isoform X2 n=1 Tax=Sinocyclocheilus rhinocerous TaxID=307959 RepID=UPI0007B9AB4C|nr:PREDICTED: uncharacterized protein LOC107748254 isoform X2 [Sinocyclocheilus rhinocerous]
MLDLRPLLQMRPVLSVMHAKAHSTKCEIIWSGKNQEGAGTTAGEEVEMVNSYLSRCALTTKYMTKSARNDMLTVHAIGRNRRKREGLHLALSSRCIKTFKKAEAESQRLEGVLRTLCFSGYMMSDNGLPRTATKFNTCIEENCGKRKVLQAIKLYNEQVPDEEERSITEEKVVVGCFSYSWRRRRELSEAQKELKLPQRKLKTECPTRKARHLVPTWQDVEVLEAVNNSLSPLAEFTDALSGEQYVGREKQNCQNASRRRSWTT